MALANRCFLLSRIIRSFLFGQVKRGALLVTPKQFFMLASCNMTPPYAPHFRSICFCPPHNTHNCGAVLCWLAEALHKTPLFFPSLCREAVSENMTAEQLHLMWQEAPPIYFDWPCFMQAPATFPMRATMHSDLRCGNLKCEKRTAWAGERGGHEWMKKARVPPESALLSGVICGFFSSWSHINCYYAGFVRNQGQVTHIHECKAMWCTPPSKERRCGHSSKKPDESVN